MSLACSACYSAWRTFVVTFCAALSVLCAACSRQTPTPRTPKPIQADVFEIGPLTPVTISPGKDLTKFLHSDHTEQVDARLTCNYCHGVEANLQKLAKYADNPKEANKPPYPGHASCMACHMAEFTRTQNAPIPTAAKAVQDMPTGPWSGMCYVCHRQVGLDREGVNAMDVFPARLSHNVVFTAEQHREHLNYVYPSDLPNPQLAGKKMDDKTCRDCHTVLPWPQPGVSFEAHTTCYACHRTSEYRPPAIGVKSEVPPGALASGACNTCHVATTNLEELRPLAAKMQGVRSYSFKFTHDSHQQGKCTDCHNLDGTYANQVGTPRAKQHLTGVRTVVGQGCFSCHDGKRAFGDLDADGRATQEHCLKCHTPAQLRPLFGAPTTSPSARASLPTGSFR
ncbi:MAG: cytochrome c3 family protein [Chloracidobacterium sp.]|nr:cytochrome c3 family protein [Chloracidobacterium sp.]MDW8218317.1 cytochrome c3 family protein [Acidobacteriota bacterium]